MRTSQGNTAHDHNHHGFTVWLDAGGVKIGFAFGSIDNYGSSGRDFDLTDVRHHLTNNLLF